MSLQRNYYEVMGLPPGATTDQIKKKYRELARQFHPDVAQDKAISQRMFTQINQAYSVLGNPERRAQYNGVLQNTPPPAAAPPQAAPPPAKPVSVVKAQALPEMLGRAESAIMAGNPVEARAFCMRVLETDPRQVRALELLGDALAQMGRRDEAAVQYRRAVQIAPSTMIQAKLNRVAAPPAPSRPVPPQSPNPASSAGGVQKTLRPGGADEPEKPGLLGRLLGRK